MSGRKRISQEWPDLPASEAIEDFNKWREEVGLRPIKQYHGKKKIRTVSLSDAAMEGLRYLAMKFDCRHGGTTSTSAFLEMIGTYQLIVMTHDELSKLRAKALRGEQADERTNGLEG